MNTGRRATYGWGRNNMVVGMLVASLLAACSRDDAKSDIAAREPVPSGAPPSVTSSASAASASAASITPPAPPKPPTLKVVPMDVPEVKGAVTLHPIDGAVMMVTTDGRIGRLSGDGAEWVGRIPKGSPYIGPNEVQKVVGSWPDFVATIYRSANGRAPSPTYQPLKGGGGEYTFAPGGGAGFIAGVAKSGETTTIAGYDFMSGYQLIKVNGPMVKPTMTSAKDAGCDTGLENGFAGKTPFPAVTPSEYTSTRAGTIASLGRHCKTKSAALEVWRDPKQPSQIHPLWEHLNKTDDAYGMDLLRGRDDTLYLVSAERKVVLRYRDGKVEPLPRLPRELRSGFVSQEGDLFASDGSAVFALVKDAWVQRLELDWPDRYARFARLGETFIVNRGGKLYALKQTPPIALDPSQPSDCKTPFVHVFDVSDVTQKQHRFPDSAKRLSTFDGLDRVELVDFRESGRRRIGIIADDWETAKAVLEHTRSTNPKHQPRLVCYAPSEPRVLTVKPSKRAPKTANSASAAGK